VLIYSIGKDNSVMLHMDRKAFYPVVHEKANAHPTASKLLVAARVKLVEAATRATSWADCTARSHEI
jgi:hypothetical protein